MEMLKRMHKIICRSLVMALTLLSKLYKQSESVRPGVVSCADILKIAARNVVASTGGPLFNVQLGRQDGLISQTSRVTGNLPDPTFNLVQLNTIFAKNNLTELDMIALSGAHTYGFSHCNHFANRLYSFSPASAVDPSLNPAYAQQLMAAFPQNVDPNIAIDMDPQTATLSTKFITRI